MSGPVDVRKVPKPWGHEIIWAHTDRYVGKILHVKAGEKLSIQYHERKDETVYLLRGEMKYWVQLPGDTELRASLHDPRAGNTYVRIGELRFRHDVDPSWLSPAARAEYASGIDSCALALDLRKALGQHEPAPE